MQIPGSREEAMSKHIDRWFRGKVYVCRCNDCPMHECGKFVRQMKLKDPTLGKASLKNLARVSLRVRPP